MAAKRTFQWLAVLIILAASFTPAENALAGGGCASYITVQWGDTLSGLAALCGTTIEAIQVANPGLGWWVYAGQVLYIPSGYAPAYTPSTGGTYTIQWGDTLGDIAARNGYSLSDLLAVNRQIGNASLIYPGQTINLPTKAGAPATPYYPPAYPPTPTVVDEYGNLKVAYRHGLIVRTGPGKNYPEIHSLLVSAVDGSKWQYRKTSVTIDSVGYVWVEVTLNPMVEGYSTGWILVRDTLGTYYTSPQIDP